MSPPRARLIIICGLPGAGKTTRAKAIAESSGGTRFSPDDWMEALAIGIWDQDRRARIEKLQWELARDLLALGGTAIIEWGTWGRAERDTLRIEARALGAAVELIYLTAETEVLFERISRRGRESPPISREMLDDAAAKFQAPTPEEFTQYDAPTEDGRP